MLVEVDGLEAVQALRAEVLLRRSQGWAPDLVDVVPGARTLLLDGIDPQTAGRELPTWGLSATAGDRGPIVDIGCVYDGPDLPEVAEQWRVSASDVVEIHTSIVHSVAFCGFAPGFAYMTGIGEERTVARRSNPRTAVPAGSVAVAGVYTGIYPTRSPGGWQLIGHTETVVWDPARKPPALLEPGRRVRFIDLSS
ncbi:MAG: allophanate hydrolase subunit 1 [Acidimicrobiaceae bacterium]|nr:allophanate hydrolase subunit 1 [Acidimicrobiaceae bacterium]